MNVDLTHAKNVAIFNAICDIGAMRSTPFMLGEYELIRDALKAGKRIMVKDGKLYIEK